MKTIKKTIQLLLVLVCIQSVVAQSQSKEPINKMLDAWHQAAANANFNAYFDAMTNDAIFIGTDANENWDKKAFIAFAKPYFDKQMKTYLRVKQPQECCRFYQIQPVRAVLEPYSNLLLQVYPPF